MLSGSYMASKTPSRHSKAPPRASKTPSRTSKTLSKRLQDALKGLQNVIKSLSFRGFFKVFLMCSICWSSWCYLGPTWPPRRHQDPPRHLREPPRRLQEPPKRRPRRLQDAFKSLQGALKPLIFFVCLQAFQIFVDLFVILVLSWSNMASKTPSRPSKILPRASKTPSRTSQDAP